MKLPNVSICIPTYNGQEYLEECLDSVVNQTLPNIEILIVDDQSSDETVKICKNYAKHDSRINVFINKKNLGLVGNWNNCHGLAKNKWIKFVFQDDIIHPYCVERMIFYALKNNTLFSICNRKFIIESNADNEIRKYFENKLKKLNDFNYTTQALNKGFLSQIIAANPLENIFGEPTTYLYHKRLIDKYGSFNKNIDQLCDYEFVLRTCLNEKITHVNEVLAYFRVHGTAQSNVNRGVKRDITKRMKVDYVDNLFILKNLQSLVESDADKEKISIKISEIKDWIQSQNEIKEFQSLYKSIHGSNLTF